MKPDRSEMEFDGNAVLVFDDERTRLPMSEPDVEGRRSVFTVCCDCGLVHQLRFVVFKLTKRLKRGYWEGKRVKGHKVMFAAYRDVRATAATRCQRKRKKIK